VACGLCSCAAVEYEHKHLIILVTENGFRCRLLLARESAVFLFQKKKERISRVLPCSSPDVAISNPKFHLATRDHNRWILTKHFYELTKLF